MGAFDAACSELDKQALTEMLGNALDREAALREILDRGMGEIVRIFQDLANKEGFNKKVRRALVESIVDLQNVIAQSKHEREAFNRLLLVRNRRADGKESWPW